MLGDARHSQSIGDILLRVIVDPTTGKIDGDLLLAGFLLCVHLRLKLLQFGSLLFTQPFIVAIEVVGSIIDDLRSLCTRSRNSFAFVDQPGLTLFDRIQSVCL